MYLTRLISKKGFSYCICNRLCSNFVTRTDNRFQAEQIHRFNQKSKFTKEHSILSVKVETLYSSKQQPILTKCIPESSQKPEDIKQTDKSVIDVRLLDLRVGRILEICKHPDADSLYVQKIDCGEEQPRSVVSGLVNHVPINEMQDKLVILLCNLKPTKIRGYASQAMIMCASSAEKIEVLIPPSNAIPGDLVSCEGYPRQPEVQIKPKKKIFETCINDLQTNEECIACYKDSPLNVPGKGPVKCESLRRVKIL